VQALPSSQVTGGKTQPSTASQASVVQALPSLQIKAPPPTQFPPEHVSTVVHTLPSLQTFVLLVCCQPSTGSQESVVQSLPSSHASGSFTCRQPEKLLQESVVQTLASSQLIGWK
jgi:hypothetical protein